VHRIRWHCEGSLWIKLLLILKVGAAFLISLKQINCESFEKIRIFSFAMSTLGVSLGERFGCVLWGLVLRKKQSVQILRQLEDIRWVIIIYYDLPSQTVTLRL